MEKRNEDLITGLVADVKLLTAEVSALKEEISKVRQAKRSAYRYLLMGIGNSKDSSLVKVLLNGNTFMVEAKAIKLYDDGMVEFPHEDGSVYTYVDLISLQEIDSPKKEG